MVRAAPQAAPTARPAFAFCLNMYTKNFEHNPVGRESFLEGGPLVMYEMMKCLLEDRVWDMSSWSRGLPSGVVATTYLGSVGLERALTSWLNLPPEVSPSGPR